MGQGFSLATPSAGSAGIDIPELSDLVYEKSLGSARFMKSIRARHHDGVVLVKVLVKPFTPMDLKKYKKGIIGENDRPFYSSLLLKLIIPKTNEKRFPTSPMP